MIRPYREEDWESVWQIIEPVFRAGTTYAFPATIPESEARKAWIIRPAATYVFEDGGDILGTYYLKPNHPGPGSHIGNCGYIVSDQARGRGIASQMCLHSLSEARRRGFLGMQFNLVVSTNEAAVRLWQKLGFTIIGTIPNAYQHASLGLVDAHVMYRSLQDQEPGDSA